VGVCTTAWIRRAIHANRAENFGESVAAHENDENKPESPASLLACEFAYTADPRLEFPRPAQSFIEMYIRSALLKHGIQNMLSAKRIFPPFVLLSRKLFKGQHGSGFTMVET